MEDTGQLYEGDECPDCQAKLVERGGDIKCPEPTCGFRQPAGVIR